MEKTVFEITKMDCPSEEALIRAKLEGASAVKKLVFDISNRKLTIYHNGQISDIESAILSLNLGARKLITEGVNQIEFSEEKSQRKLLWTVLIINFGFFIVEITAGFFSKSMGLVADSLDMLADSIVYGMSLFAVGGTALRKKSVAKLAGYFQIILSVIGFCEILRRFFGAEKMPEFSTMIVVSALALVGNGLCLYLMQKSRSKDEIHIKASMIFTSNDVIINMGVMLAGILVYSLHSNIPDLIIGTIVFGIVMQGAVRILKLGK